MLSHPGLIAVFSVVVIIMLLLDLGVFNKNAHHVTSKEAITWSVVWIGLSMIFSGVIYYVFSKDGHEFAVEKFSQYQSAYWIEKALSIDNLFVFILVFNFFKVPDQYHHKVLFWGIIGALIFRAIFIFAGVELIKITYLPPIEIMGAPREINVVLTIFGFFLMYAGIKSWFTHGDDTPPDFNENVAVKLLNKIYKGRIAPNFDGDKFFTIQNGVKMITPLFVVLVIIEFSDLIFAVDSIPAIFAIAPDDPFILYSSNIFAILGLRSLYFILANFIQVFSKLPYGLAIILTFIGIKMLIGPFYHIEAPVSLGVVAAVLVLSVVASILFPEKKEADTLQ